MAARDCRDAKPQDSSDASVRYRTFAEFRDPFTTGDIRRLRRRSWCATRSRRSKPGPATPAIRARPTRRRPSWSASRSPPQTPLHEEARRMTRLYSEVAYASGRISPAAAESLRELWSLMQANSGQLVAR